MRQFAGYELLDELGRGGMGVVYRARDPRLGREVALKVLAPERASPEARARFRREAQALARLEHPHVVKVHAAGEAEGRLFMAMDLVPGEPLSKVLHAGPVSTDRARAWVHELALALEAVHAQGVIHRDLKPENVLIDPAGKARLLDFGVSRLLDDGERLSATGQLVGTPGYWAPEQATGERETVGVPTDIHGLGALLYACLTGRPPFEGATLLDAVVATVGHEPEPPSALRPDVPADLDAITLRCLAKEPADRYPTARELAEALAGRDPGRRRPPRRRAALLVGLGAALSVGLWAASRAVDVEAAAALRVAPALELAAPPAISFKPLVELDGRLLSAAGPCEVRVGARRARVAPADGRDTFRLSLPLSAGLNVLTVEVVDLTTGVAGQPQTVQVRHAIAPRWFQELAPDRRPPLPLPPGLGFGGLPGEYVYAADQSVLVYVPPGSFEMGAEVELRYDRDPRPRHRVTLTRGYYIGKFEVSWAQWKTFHSETERPPPTDFALGLDDRDPAVGVGWEAAAAYCTWVGLRLPTEAEWEFAARGPQSWDYPWGRELEDDRLNVSNDAPVPVDSLPAGASPVGAHHMSGNVAEWVFDTYARYPAGPQVDPVQNEPDRPHVVRDAGWAATAHFACTYMRAWGDSQQPRTDYGFRVALSAE